jgi:gamma-glutamyltranspeptidase/glutathione hydrolase
MNERRKRPSRAAPLLLALALVLALGAGGEARATAAAEQPRQPYTLDLSALTGPAGTDVYATVTRAAGAGAVPDVLEKLEVRSLDDDGSVLAVHHYRNVAAPDGVARVSPPGLPRGRQLKIRALVEAPDGTRTYVLWQTGAVRYRPDLVVADVAAPARVVRRQSFAVDVTVGETAGDTAAAATLSLYDGADLVGSRLFTIAPGGATIVSFPLLALPEVGSHELLARVSAAAPAQLDETNDTAVSPLAVAMYDADGIVSTENRQATEVGLDVLRAGGNAFDAAAAVQFALNVVEPENSGIGGGATILVHLASGEEIAIDAREPAPADTVLRFNDRPGFNTTGLAIGVPMTLRAVDEVLDRWGTWTLAETLAPAIGLAEDGMVVSDQLARSAAGARANNYAETRAVFRPGGVPVAKGATLEQDDLAKTFRLIAAQGLDVFYRGEIAEAIVAATRMSNPAGNDGRMTLQDLERGLTDDLDADGRITAAVSVDYRGREFVSVAGSSSGGLVALQMLDLVERFPLGAGGPGWGFQEPTATHVSMEAFRLAFSDRFKWMGDPRFTPVPFVGLLDEDYLAQRSQLIRETSRIAGLRIPGNPLPYQPAPVAAESAPDGGSEGQQTSHYSIVDRWGNAVSFTTTLTDSFGTGIMVPGYGFLLNDSNSNFNSFPVASPTDPGANDLAPGKIGMGNTAPLMAFEDGELVLVTGSPGGAFIPWVVFHVATGVFDYGKTLQEAVDAARIWANLSTVLYNPGYPAETLSALRALGHPLAANPSAFPQVGSAESIAVDPDTFALVGAVDPRTLDASFGSVEPLTALPAAAAAG